MTEGDKTREMMWLWLLPSGGLKKKKNPDTWGEDMRLQRRAVDGVVNSGDSHTQAEPLEVNGSHTNHSI